MLGEKESRAIRPDAQPYDEIRIKTVPRYKESGLSGDEWRISASVGFYRKGRKVQEETYSTLEYAVMFLGSLWGNHKEGYYGGEEDFCDQEGCAERATVKALLKKEYCRVGHGTEPSRPIYRLFCDKHERRGDCGLEDSDQNYDKVPFLKQT